MRAPTPVWKIDPICTRLLCVVLPLQTTNKLQFSSWQSLGYCIDTECWRSNSRWASFGLLVMVWLIGLDMVWRTAIHASSQNYPRFNGSRPGSWTTIVNVRHQQEGLQRSDSHSLGFGQMWWPCSQNTSQIWRRPKHKLYDREQSVAK